MTARAHVAAALAALEDAGVTVYDGNPPQAAQMPYVVLYAAVGRAQSDRLSAERNLLGSDVQATVVGANALSCRIVGEKARDVLVSRLLVDGRKTWRGEHLDSQPIRRDDDVIDRVVFYGVDRYRLTSTH